MSYTLVLEWMPGDLYMSAVTARCTAPTSSYSVVWLPPNKVYQITLYCGSTSLVSFLVGAFRGKAWSYMSSYIEVKNVSKSFSGRAILQNISLSVEQGTTVGLVGANGSGKSVLFKIICGFEKPDQGSVYVRGRQLGKNGRDFPADMGVFINSPGFIGIYSGFQNLKFLADIQGKIGEKEIRQAMSKVGLDPDNKTKVDNYSLGMKQKLGLAQAIMEGQDILILDEPFNALDYKTYEDVKTIIRMLKAEGKTIFLTSHHFKDIEQLCDQVYSIEDCRLIPITEEIAARYREME